MLRLCFVALNAYPAIDSRVGSGFGGIETRSSMLARGVAQLPATEVQFVVRVERPLLQATYDNVRLHALHDPLFAVRNSLVSRLKRTPAFPFVHLQHPKLSDAVFLPWLAVSKLLRGRPDPRQPSTFLRSIATDVWVTFGVQSFSATVIATARSQSVPTVLVLGSDSDLDERYLPVTDYVSVYRDRGDVCRWVIDNADVIVCQTEAQQQVLQSRFGRTGTLLQNPIDLARWDQQAQISISPTVTAGLQRYALWVGRADGEHKRPQLLLDVAALCPEVPFLMVLNPRDDVLAARIHATAPSNVRIVERVAFEEMPPVMRGAAVLVNTSSLEGFPNTYLQAMASGTPVASLVVEQEFLQRSYGGVATAGDIAQLAAAVRAAWAGKPVGFQAESARNYVEQHHTLAACADQLRVICVTAAQRD